MALDPQSQKLLLASLAKRANCRLKTNALRLVNDQADGLAGLVLEQFNRHFSFQVFHERWLKKTEDLKNFLSEHFPVDFLIVKDRSQNASSKKEDVHSLIVLQNSSSKTIVQENGLFFEVDLYDGLNTGLFLDMRSNRLKAGQACAGKRILNCFSYTCSFGVYARTFGAREVINVDISSKALSRGKRNYELNQLDPYPGELIKADVMAYLHKAVKKDNRFDVVIIDPPSFARVDGQVFQIEKSMPVLIDQASSLINPKGKILLATNFSGLSHDRLENLLKSYSRRLAKKVTRLTQDKDFPGSGLRKDSYLAALWIEY